MARPQNMLTRLSVGLFLCCSLIMLSFYGKEVLEKLKDNRMHHMQEERKQQIRDVCQSHNNFTKYPNIGRNFLVDDAHGVIYCFIPKVACSNLKKFMVVLEKGEPFIDPILLPGFAHDSVTPLIRFKKAEINAKLKHYTKFLFVRDPFVRLVSVYRDKLQRYRPKFYDILRPTILRNTNPDLLKMLKGKPIDITFHDFIRYLLDPSNKGKPFNPHWQQMYSLCQPCHIKYDFIGHVETFQGDMEHLLKTLMLAGDVKVRGEYNNMTTSDSLVEWFRAVPLEERRKLYELYEADFKLFGYTKPEELFHG